MSLKKVNWFGLAGGIMLLVIVLLALVYASPWWQASAAQGVVQADFSPLSYSISILGESVKIPLFWFLNLTSLLFLASSAIAIIVYSLLPDKSYSKHLLGFAYLKPLIILIVFVVVLFVATYLATFLANMFVAGSIPLMGSASFNINADEMTMEIPITTGFTWVFVLAIVAAVLCVVARFYHRKIVQAPATIPPQTPA